MHGIRLRCAWIVGKADAMSYHTDTIFQISQKVLDINIIKQF
jgi:hypothetical protein